MNEFSISESQLEQIFLDALNSFKVNEVQEIIIQFLNNPQFIFLLLSLSNSTKNPSILIQCSIQCYHSLKMHWTSYSIENQQFIFDQLLNLASKPNSPSYFSVSISYIISKEDTPNYQNQAANYILSIINIPNFIQSIHNNMLQFLSFLKLLLAIYAQCPLLFQVDFSPVFVHAMENPTLFTPQILQLTIKFLATLVHLRGNGETQDSEDKCPLLQNYAFCFHLFCYLPYHAILSSFWTTAMDFIISGILNSEDVNHLYQIAMEFINNQESKTSERIVVLPIFSFYPESFPTDFIYHLFEIYFTTFTQILIENNSFPIDYLNLLDVFFDYSKDEPIVNELYLYIKNQILSNESDIIINISSLGFLSVFLTNSPCVILNDYDFFISYLIRCLDSNIYKLKEMCLYLINNIGLIKLNSFFNTFCESIPFLLQKISLLIVSTNISHELRFDSINSFISLYEIHNSISKDSISHNFNGLFNLISQSENLFSKDNLDLFVICESISILFDSSVTNDQLISLYQFAKSVLAQVENPILMEKCFFLLTSILKVNIKYKRGIDFDYLFTIPTIQFILTESEIPASLIKSALIFMKDIIKLYKNNANEFESASIDLLFHFIPTIDETFLIMNSIKIIAISAKFSSNFEAANLIMENIFNLLNQRDRILTGIKILKTTKKIISLLNPENLNRLFTLQTTIIYENPNDKLIISESFSVIKKIFKFYLSIIQSQAEKNPFNFPIIEIVQKLIEDFINNNLKIQDQLNSPDCYFCFIPNICDLISIIWNFPNEKNRIFYEFLINYVQFFLSEENQENYPIDEDDDYGIEHVIGCIGDAISLNAINASDLASLSVLIANLSSLPTLNLSTKQNICFLLNQILNFDVNLVVPLIDNFLAPWFMQCLASPEKDEDGFLLISNISFLFFEIYGKTKPVFPSSHANELLINSIQIFPPKIQCCFQYTKTLLNSLLKNFFSPLETANLATLTNASESSNIDLAKIYSSIVASFIQLLNLDNEELFERDLSENEISYLKKLIFGVLNQNEEIRNAVSQLVPSEMLNQLFEAFAKI